MIPLTLDNRVRLSLMGHETVYGIVCDLDGCIALDLPEVPEDAAHEALPEITVQYGYSAMFKAETCTREDVMEWRKSKRPVKPEEWTVPYIAARHKCTPGAAAKALQLHGKRPDLSMHMAVYVATKDITPPPAYKNPRSNQGVNDV